MTWSLQLFFLRGGGFISDTDKDNYEAQKTDGTNDDDAIFRYIMPLTILLKQILSFRFLECHLSISSNQSPQQETNLRGHLSEGCSNTFRIQYLRPSKGQKWKLQCEGENVTRLQQGRLSQSCQNSEPETGTKCRQASYIRLNGRQKFYKWWYPQKKLLPLGRASPSPTQLNSDALFWSKVTTCLSPKRWFNLSKLFRSGITEAAKGTSNKSRNSWDLGPMPQPQTNCNRTVKLSWRKNWMLRIWASNWDQHLIPTESIWIHISYMDP